jgi:hypothetical protein
MQLKIVSIWIDAEPADTRDRLHLLYGKGRLSPPSPRTVYLHNTFVNFVRICSWKFCLRRCSRDRCDFIRKVFIRKAKKGSSFHLHSPQNADLLFFFLFGQLMKKREEHELEFSGSYRDKASCHKTGNGSPHFSLKRIKPVTCAFFPLGHVTKYMRKKQCKGGRVYFGSQFQRFQSMVG